MSDVATPLFLVAATVLCIAGALKLRSPRRAAEALQTLGLPARRWHVRIGAGVEIGLGVACAVTPSWPLAAVLAGAYATFALAGAALRGRGGACGCFGEDETPVSHVHVVTSAGLAAVAAAAAITPEHGLGWLLSRPALFVGIAGVAYAVVLVYIEVPRAWEAWSGR